MFITFITIIHIIVAVFMVIVVLLQGGNQGGIGAAFGGANTSGVFGAAGATSFLGKLTYGAAAIFMITSIALTMIEGKTGNIGLKERLKANATEKAGETTPSNPPAQPQK